MCALLFSIQAVDYIKTFAVCIKAFSMNGCRPVRREIG